jgi:integrase/recombinase XerD
MALVPGSNGQSDTTIERLFKRRGFRARLLECMLAPYWGDLAAWMAERGHPQRQIYETIRLSLRLAEYAARVDGLTDPALLTGGLIVRYGATMTGHRRLQQDSRLCQWRLLTFLRERGIVRPEQPPSVEPCSQVLTDYLNHLAEHRGLGKKSIAAHRKHVALALEAFGLSEDGAAAAPSVDAAAVFDHVMARAPSLSRSERKAMCAALRSFLRFLHLSGYLMQDFSEAVPVIPSFKLDRLPQVIAPEAINKILAVVDRSTAMGLRDYAILFILATYGLRSGQLCALRLEDFDWRQETLRIRGVKGGEDVLLPLLPAVGEAVIAYLREGRPSSGASREVFVRVRAPIGPLKGNLRNIIKPYARKVALDEVPLGAHAWRHGCASRMLASGQTLKTIRDTLGHRSIETTFIYTKVDVRHLREAALEWPWTPP